MSQLERLAFGETLLKIATGKRMNPQQSILIEFQNEANQRMICPLCMYTSKKNKSTAIIKNGFFKCFACGKSGRTNDC